MDYPNENRIRKKVTSYNDMDIVISGQLPGPNSIFRFYELKVINFIMIINSIGIYY